MPTPPPNRIEKIADRAEIARRCAAWRAAGKRIVFANGCFDGLHGGHVSYIEDSARQGDVLVVGVNDDASTRGLKGEGRPIMNEVDRMEMLAALEWTDAVVTFHEPTCAELLRELRPHVHAKGTDYSAETVPERETALAEGIKIYIAGPPKENSTHTIVERMKR